MDLGQATRRRNLAGRICAVFCLIAFLAMVDALIAKFREPIHVFHVLPGAEVPINGPLPEDIKKPTDLIYESTSASIKVTFEDIHSGYFLGGNMWRGRLFVGPESAPGKYVVLVKPKQGHLDKPLPPYGVVVYADPMSHRQSYRSIIRRQTGLSPWLMAAFFAPFIGVTLGVVFLYSRRIEGLLELEGLAEIYKVTRGEGDYLVVFVFGEEHGLTLGQEFTILDPEGHQVGYGKVQELTPRDAVGKTWMDQMIRAGYLVSLKR
jgi:hypothetical protein